MDGTQEGLQLIQRLNTAFAQRYQVILDRFNNTEDKNASKFVSTLTLCERKREEYPFHTTSSNLCCSLCYWSNELSPPYAMEKEKNGNHWAFTYHQHGKAIQNLPVIRVSCTFQIIVNSSADSRRFSTIFIPLSNRVKNSFKFHPQQGCTESEIIL